MWDDGQNYNAAFQYGTAEIRKSVLRLHLLYFFKVVGSNSVRQSV